MMGRPVDIDEYIGKDYSIICANIRLAQFLKHRYAQQQLQNGLKSWETPDILPWASWIRRCWSDLRIRHKELELLLNSTQELLLWQQIINAQAPANFLWHIPSVAAQAQAAWQIKKQYRIPELSKTETAGKDAVAFRDWSQAFTEHCRRKNIIDAASVPERIGGDLISNLALPSKGILLAGFEGLAPQQEEFARQLRGIGMPVIQHQDTEARSAQVQVAECRDISEEIRWSAQWAKQIISEKPKAKIGILVPNLRELRPRIEQTFEEVLSPGCLNYGSEQRPPPFSISLGRPLLDYPMISIIFTILELKPRALPLASVSELLRTPFIKGCAKERASRALFDEKLRRRNQQVYDLDEIKYHAAQMGKRGQSLVVFVRCLTNLCKFRKQLPAQCAPSRWSECFSEMLEIAGWPGERELNSNEQQQNEAWGSILEKLASTHVVKPGIVRYEALSVLRRVADEQSFQQHTPEPPVEVMDPQGAAAMRFDHVWMLGMNENAWPSPAVPNPFLPIKLQIKHEVPHADSRLHLDWTEQLQQRILRSSPDAVLSFSLYEGDRPLLGSPLLPSGGRFESTCNLSEILSYPHLVFDSRDIEDIEDSKAPPLDAFKGGTGLFGDQSQCPFRAFAKHRLHSRGLEDPDIGISPMQRGLMMHRLMQLFWDEVKTRDALEKRSDDENAQLIKSLVDQQIREQRTRMPTTFMPRFSKIEAQKMESAMITWMGQELARKPFRVRDNEFTVQATVEGIEFQGRVDRIDELEDGSLVIIDYKTGIPNINDWRSARPLDPQMPVYAVAIGGMTAAVVFAILKRGDSFGYTGLVRRENVFDSERRITGLRKQVKGFESDLSVREKFFFDDAEYKTWEDLLDRWRENLEAIAIEFREGRAMVRPIKPSVCRWCDQTPFCRIHEVSKG